MQPKIVGGLYRFHTHCHIGKMYSRNLYNRKQAFAAVKTESLNFSKLVARLLRFVDSVLTTEKPFTCR